MTWDRHPLEELHDLVTGRVSDEERSRMEQHLETCATCPAELRRIAFTREIVRKTADTAEIPPDLQMRVAAALGRAVAPRRLTRTRLAFAIAASAAAIALLMLLRPWHQPDLPSSAAADYAAVASNEQPLQMRTSDPARLEQWLDARLPFQTRVFDFGMMRYELLGGSLDSLAQHRSALFAYRGERGDVIVCQMFEGNTAELPAGAETRIHNDITFHIYQRDARTVVFWQEGTVVCVLAGEGAPDDVIALAFAKAMHV